MDFSKYTLQTNIQLCDILSKDIIKFSDNYYFIKIQRENEEKVIYTSNGIYTFKCSVINIIDNKISSSSQKEAVSVFIGPNSINNRFLIFRSI